MIGKIEINNGASRYLVRMTDGTNPLRKSIIRTRIPIVFDFVTSKLFKAPTFPEPVLVISIFLLLTNKYAVGIEPIK